MFRYSAKTVEAIYVKSGICPSTYGKILKGPLGEVISNSCTTCDLIIGISLVGTSQVALFGNEIEHDMVMSLIRSRAMQVSSDKGNNTRLSRFKRRKIRGTHRGHMAIQVPLSIIGAGVSRPCLECSRTVGYHA